MPYLLAASVGGLVAFVFAIPAIVLEFMEHGVHGSSPLIVDVKTIFGRKLERREVFLSALLLHLLIGAMFGAAYILFVRYGWLVVTNAPFTLLSLVVFAVGSWIVAGIGLFPLLGMGLFGRKEGSHVWSEMLVSHLLIGLGLWAVVRAFGSATFIG